MDTVASSHEAPETTTAVAEMPEAASAVEIEEEEETPLSSTTPTETTPDTADSESSKDAEWEDILGTGAVRKKVVSVGDTTQRPAYGQRVTLKYSGKLSEGGEIFQEPKEETVTVGDGDIVAGVELAIKMMSLGEQAIVECDSRFGYGEKGSKALNVPGGANLEFAVELVSLGSEKKAPAQMTVAERLELALDKKTKGTAFFKDEQYDKALRCYRAGLGLCETDLKLTEAYTEEAKAYKKCRLDCGNNVVVCLMKQEKFKEAKEACIVVLQFDTSNLRALQRASELCIKNGDHEEADVVLKKGLKLYPEDKLLQRQSKMFEDRKKRIKMKERQMYKQMFKPSSSPKAVNSTPATPTKPSTTVTPSAKPGNVTGSTKNSKANVALETASSNTKNSLMPWILAPVAVGVAAMVYHFIWKRQ
mmetsp:Transcript_50241/g.98493  ORF Transcript_50241/g.98493 Transcript_50241/m.98493 type:complete len:419 (-) Transcript_50241:161-1417(-)